MKAAMLPVVGLLGSSLLWGCAVGPDYLPPDDGTVELANAESEHLSEQLAEAEWWRQFADPVLDRLIDRALRGDLDLAIAAARVNEARAILGGERRGRWPVGSVQASYDRSHAQQPGFGTERIEADAYQTGVASFWELDLFGGVRRGVEAAAADAGAAQAELRDVQVLVAAEVAASYLELRRAQKRRVVAEANMANQRETLRLTEVRYELGRGSELDVASATARLAATEAVIPQLVAAEAAARHRLAVLAGVQPGALDAELGFAEAPPHLTTLAIGGAEELLRRRPDIRAAERRLAAATARIGVARAALFPRVTLDGFIGFVTGDAAELGESSSRAWRMTPVLSWAGLDLGRVRAQVAAAEARAAGAVAAYELTVLRALEETENALVDYEQSRRRLVAVVEQATASRRAADLARIQYREGALDFLRMLDAERTVLEAEDAVASAEADLNLAVVAIYRALGGSWEAAPPTGA